MKPDEFTISRIKQELETVSKVLENPETEVIYEVSSRLEKLTYELEMFAKSAGELQIEEVQEINDYVNTVQDQLNERVQAGGVPKDMTERLFDILGRLNNASALIGYFLAK